MDDVKLFFEGDKVICEMEYDCKHFEEIKEYLKKRNFRWSNPRKIWYRKNFYSKDLESIVKRLKKWEHVSIDPSVSTFVETLHSSETENYERSFAIDYSDRILDHFEEALNIRGNLYDFQKGFLEYLEETGNTKVLLADQMGLGKTIMGIALYQVLRRKNGIKKLLVVCPASVKLNWQREIEKWIDDGIIMSQILFGWKGYESYDEYGDLDVMIINYSIFEKRKEDLEKFNPDMLILDESQYIKNYKAKRTKAILDFVKKIDPEHILALTGTPFLNYPRELITLLQLFKKLDYFGGFWRFMKKYCDAGEQWVYIKGGERRRFHNWNGAKNLDDLSMRLRSLLMIRREKKDVLDLPEKRELEVYFAMDPEFEERYQIVNDNVRMYFSAKYEDDEKKWKIIEEWLKAISLGIYSEEFAQIRRMLGSSWGEVLSQIEALKQVVAESKLEPAMEWIHNFLDTTDEKIVIFTRHKNILNALAEEFKDWGMRTIEGQQKVEIRQQNIDDFQEKKNVRLMVANIRAGGIGITLNKASTVIFLELDWNYSLHEQASDRLHRIGQKNRVDAYFFLTAGTIDEWLYSMVIKKKRIFDEVFKS